MQVAGTSTLHTHRGSPHSPRPAITRRDTTAAGRPPRPESLAAARRHSPRPAATHRGSRHSPGHGPRSPTTRVTQALPGPESLAAASDCSLFQPRPESLAGLPSFRLAAAPVTPRSPPSLAHSVSAAARRHLPRPGAGVTRRGPSHSPRSAITHRGSPHSRWPTGKSPRRDRPRPNTGWEAPHDHETSTSLHQISPLSILGPGSMQFQGHPGPDLQVGQGWSPYGTQCWVGGIPWP